MAAFKLLFLFALSSVTCVMSNVLAKKIGPDTPLKFPIKPAVGGLPPNVLDAFANQFPEFVFIEVNEGESSIQCQGVLINTYSILTAASCFWSFTDEMNLNASNVGVGMGNVYTINPEIEINKIIIHPQYRYYPLSRVHENNLAILNTTLPIPLGDFLAPITVAGSANGRVDANVKITTALLAGWGDITNPSNYSDPDTTSNLKYARVTIAAQKACAAIYSSSVNYMLGDTMICSNNTATSTSSCQGDQGAALRYLDSRTVKPVLFAIATNPVEKRCPTYLPSLYTNVGAFSKWLNANAGLKLK